MNAAGVASEAHATTTIDRAFWELMIEAALLVAGLAVAIGAIVVVAIRVTRPLSALSIVVERLANNDTTVEIQKMARNDELGTMAVALAVFKDALIAKRASDEAAALDAEVKIERGRRVDSITRHFESVIGEIVETLSSASAQLEVSATTLTGTAVRSQELATTVAAASEEASTNVQSVASATRKCPRRSTRSAVRCRNRQGWPTRRSIRRTKRMIASASCRRPQPGLATWSN